MTQFSCPICDGPVVFCRDEKVVLHLCLDGALVRVARETDRPRRFAAVRAFLTAARKRWRARRR
jgi:hypothetical protein